MVQSDRSDRLSHPGPGNLPVFLLVRMVRMVQAVRMVRVVRLVSCGKGYPTAHVSRKSPLGERAGSDLGSKGRGESFRCTLHEGRQSAESGRCWSRNSASYNALKLGKWLKCLGCKHL